MSWSALSKAREGEELTGVPNASVGQDDLDHGLVLPLARVVKAAPSNVVLEPDRCLFLDEEGADVLRGPRLGRRDQGSARVQKRGLESSSRCLCFGRHDGSWRHEPGEVCLNRLAPGPGGAEFLLLTATSPSPNGH